MKSKVQVTILVLFIFSFPAYASVCSSTEPSARADFESEGANESVVYSKVNKVPVVEGTVNGGGSPLPNGVIDVYGVDKYAKFATEAPGLRLIGSYLASRDGKFCLPDLDDGLYVLRVGTTKFAYKHSYIWVEKRSRFRKRVIPINLEVGT